MTTRGGYTKVWKHIHRNTALTLAERILLTEILAWEFPGKIKPTTQVELAQNTGLDRMYMIKCLKRLQADGFITAEREGRKTRYSVTADAKNGLITERVSEASPLTSNAGSPLTKKKDKCGLTPQLSEASPLTVCGVTPHSTDILVNTRATESNPKNSLRTLKEPPVPPVQGRNGVKKKQPADPRFVPLRDALVEAWQIHFGTKYAFQGVADATAIKRLIGYFSDEEIMARFAVFLRDTDSFTIKQGHTIAYFASKINAYRPAPRQKGFTLEDVKKQ